MRAGPGADRQEGGAAAGKMRGELLPDHRTIGCSDEGGPINAEMIEQVSEHCRLVEGIDRAVERAVGTDPVDRKDADIGQRRLLAFPPAGAVIGSVGDDVAAGRNAPADDDHRGIDRAARLEPTLDLYVAAMDQG